MLDLNHGGDKMYILLVYDIKENRVTKVLKYLRGYLNWVQNSVFEGELTNAKFYKMKQGLENIIVTDEDSILVYTARDKKWLSKTVIGIEKKEIDNFI
jgi:CRISPR-associated protein Cas2